jgi:GTP cyclohydrolase II
VSLSVHPKSTQSADLPEVGLRLQEGNAWVEVYAHAELPTDSGDFRIVVFHSGSDNKEHIALVRGNISNVSNVPVRLHSECLTGDVLGSLRCDCREQLERSLETLGQSQAGVLLYMRQEGRGIGLGNKIRAYALQEQGLNTYEANEHLGFDADLRDYSAAALMLKLLGVRSVDLATNNPRKMFGLRSHGIDVSARVPLVIAANPHNDRYLRTKAEKGHLL